MWCRPSDFDDPGPEVNLELLHMVSTAMRGQGLIFYEPPRLRYLDAVQFLWRSGKSGAIYLANNMIDLTSVQVWNGHDWDELTLTGLEDRAYAAVDELDYIPDYIRYSGALGLARLSALEASSTLVQGDSIIRNGAEMVIDWKRPLSDPPEPDYTFQAGDMLAEPPLDLRGVAVAITDRLVSVRRDQDSKWMAGELFDGLYDIIEVYKLGV